MTLSRSSDERNLWIFFTDKNMTGGHHICSLCHQEFTRKSNAERHNENLHSSQASIIPATEFRYWSSELHFRNNNFRPLFARGEKSREEILTDTFETIGKEFESCEHELMSFTSLTSQERAKSLGLLIMQALRSEDRKRAMKSNLRNLRRLSLSERMIGCVAAALDTPPPNAKQLLLSAMR